MTKKNLFKAAAVLFASSILLVGCSDDGGDGGDGTFTRADFIGVYEGTAANGGGHLVLGLLPVYDTITITEAPLGEDSITLHSISLDIAFNGKVVGQDIAFGGFMADSLMLSPTDTIYALDILATGSARLQSNKTTLKTNLTVDATVYNLQKVIPGQPNPKVMNNIGLPGTFQKR